MLKANSIGVSLQDGILGITLARAPLNVLDLAALQEMNAVLEKAVSEKGIKAVLFRGEGKAFSAGVDVKDHLPGRDRETVAAFGKIFARLDRIGAPTISVVQGAALGGGCELACACDFVLATPAARFGLPEVELAAFPPVAAAWFLPVIGYRNLVDLAITGRIVGAEEALRMGLVSSVVAAEDLELALGRLLGALKAKSAVALKGARRAIRGAVGLPMELALEQAESRYFAEISPSADMEEGMRSFLEKRKPVWKDR